MKKSARRILSFLTAVLLLASAMPVFASGSSELSTAHADTLNALGLFKGTGSGYDLDKTPDRTQGLVMLIRLLGKEAEALGGVRQLRAGCGLRGAPVRWRAGSGAGSRWRRARQW